MTTMNEVEWKDHDRTCLMAVGMFVAMVLVNLATTLASYHLMGWLWT